MGNKPRIGTWPGRTVKMWFYLYCFIGACGSHYLRQKLSD